jgi:sec-independent protein translocase protein TatA
MFGSVGMTEILIILLIVLILFGAKRIPEVAGSLGKGINEFKRNMSEAQRAITDPARDEQPSIGAGDRPVETPRAATAPGDEEPREREPKRLLG